MVVKKVPKKTVEMVRARTMMYNVVVQTLILHRRNGWLVAESMLKVMEGFYHQVAWRIVGTSAQKVEEEGWE